jgi:hypothetical protein
VLWQVLSLEKAMGFLEYQIQVQPSGAVEGQRRRRQVTCLQSPCTVSMEDGMFSITGLDPATDYTVSVRPVNGEGDLGEALTQTGTYVCGVGLVNEEGTCD